MSPPSLLTRLLAATLVLILLPLAVISVILYARTSDMIARARVEASGRALEHAARVVAQKLAVARSLAGVTATNPDVQAILLRDPAAYGTAQQLADMARLLEILRALELERRVLRVRLVVSDGLLYSNEGSRIMSRASISGESWVDRLLSRSDRVFEEWTRGRLTLAPGVSQDVISCIKPVRSLTDFESVPGFVIVDIPAREIEATLAESGMGESWTVWAASMRGEVLASTGRDAPAGGDAPPLARQRLVRRDGADWILSTRPIEDYGWVLGSLVSVADIHRQRNRAAAGTLALLSGLTGATFALAVVLFRRAFRRVRGLVEVMRSVQAGNLQPAVPIGPRDEIGELERDFDAMIGRIRDLRAEERALSERARDAELRALRAQISPHLLYNALNSIAWTAMDYGADRVVRMLKALSEFYRIRLHGAGGRSTLADEVRHAELYIEIQNMRYAEAISLSVSVPPDLLEAPVPTLVLQPLVENSILHGILARPDKKGRIEISACLAGTDLLLTVIDDGAGIPPERIGSLLDQGAPDGEYGLRNIQERVRLEHGPGYGVTLSAVPAGGTRVDVRVPFHRATVVASTGS